MALRKLEAGWQIDWRTVIILMLIAGFLARGTEQRQLTNLIKKAVPVETSSTVITAPKVESPSQ